MKEKRGWIEEAEPFLPGAILAWIICFFVSYTYYPSERQDRYRGVGEISSQREYVLNSDLLTFKLRRVDALSYLKGECIPVFMWTTDQDESVTIVVHEGRDPQEWTDALSLALEHYPATKVQEIDDPVPDGWKHVSILKHNGHHPLRDQRLIVEITKLVTFCPR